jgi:tetratricopeptide (TPR) repeat protein
MPPAERCQGSRKSPAPRPGETDISAESARLKRSIDMQGILIGAIRRDLAARDISLFQPADTGSTKTATGDALLAHGELAQALRTFRADLAEAERAAEHDPDAWRVHELSILHNKVGEVLMAQGNLANAAQSFRRGLAVAERLAKSDPDNAESRQDRVASCNNLDRALVAQGNLDEALRSFRQALT